MIRMVSLLTRVQEEGCINAGWFDSLDEMRAFLHGFRSTGSRWLAFFLCFITTTPSLRRRGFFMKPVSGRGNGKARGLWEGGGHG